MSTASKTPRLGPSLESLQPRRAVAIAARLDSAVDNAFARIADSGWSMLHVLGAHRWREGYETDLERGWRQYRGSRCTICDSPWEGW